VESDDTTSLYEPVIATNMTRNPAPVTPPVVLTIAGSDSGGGAGIQADLKTIEAGGAFGTSAITSVTAQNTTGVASTHVLPTEEIEAQIEAVTTDFALGAIKTGMLATSDVVELVTETVRDSPVPAVVDPVMVAASGDRLLEPEAESAYEELIAESALVTPNADEAEVLTGLEVTDSARAQQAAQQLIEMGADAALVKGGHVPGDDVVDVLATEETIETVRHTRVDTEATHGSGCTLSSAIATRLAHGDDISTAVQTGIDLLARAVRYNLDVGEGPGAVHHMVAARDQAERDPTAERVAEVVNQLVRRDVSRLVPEVGLNVIGATPYAEVPAECAAVEGRITRTLDGVAANRGVRFGASTNVARFLLAAREYDPELRFAVNCRYDDAVGAALEELDWNVADYDPTEQPEDATGILEWAASEAFADSTETPAGVVGHAAPGWEPTVVLLAADTATLADRAVTLLDAVTDDE
jgi:hydroxymethylpyrimidine/phosphomethylpyrimidine kinase